MKPLTEWLQTATGIPAQPQDRLMTLPKVIELLWCFVPCDGIDLACPTRRLYDNLSEWRAGERSTASQD